MGAEYEGDGRDKVRGGGDQGLCTEDGGEEEGGDECVEGRDLGWAM